MKVSDFIVEYLVQKESKIIFGYIGGMITHLVDSIHQHPEAKYIQVYHEQTAAIAAEGYARVSGNTGVAIATSGPGATNMITGIANAFFDSIPVIYITGQVNTYEFKYEKPIRQQGFQETDVVSIVTPITKYAKLIDKTEDIIYELEKAFYIANDGRKGPVLLDIPMNIQREDIVPENFRRFSPVIQSEQSDINWENVKTIIQESQRPLVLLGGGVNTHEGKKALKSFLQKYKIPVVSSLMGKGTFDENESSFIGMIGSYGNRCANISIAHADLLIVIGSRLDTRQTGAKFDSFLTNGNIIHVDIDNDELEFHRLPNRLKINCDAIIFLSQLCASVLKLNIDANWFSFIDFLKLNYSQRNEVDRFVENKAPYSLMYFLNKVAPIDCIYTVDIGQNQMWAAQTLSISSKQMFLTSGGHAPMGYALPAAVGAAMVNPSKRIFVICGDGGFHMATQALMLISQYKLPITVIVINNYALGMITQFQELYFNKRMAGTIEAEGYCVPDIEKVAQSYGIPYLCLQEDSLREPLLGEEILALPFSVIEFKIEGETKVYPKLEYNRSIDDSFPYLSENDFSLIRSHTNPFKL